MAKFNIGDKVLNAVSQKHGIVITVAPKGRGHQLYRVNYGDRENDEMESDLIADIDITDPFERIANNIYETYLDFSKQNTTFKIQNSNNSTISSLKAARTLFKAYQFKPLLKFLNSVNRRLLVADEVGLGKTIEAGHIMLELKARKELNNVLIVCPKSLQRKWFEELKDKFGLIFTIYEKNDDLIEDLKYKNGTVRGIINYEKIRLKNIEEEPDENGKKKKKKVNDLTDYLVEQNLRFSLLVCDEAHRLRNEETQQYRGAERLMDCTDAAIFLTATPVMISSKNLYNLLHLLDNAKYYNPQIFDNLLEENKPFIIALSALNAGLPLPEIAEQLSNSKVTTRFINEETQTVISSETKTIDERFGEYPIYKRLINNLKTGQDSHVLRAQIQQDLSAMSVMNNIFSRTRKKEVTTDMSQAVRDPYPCVIPLYEDEWNHYEEIIEQYYEDNSYTTDWGEEIFYGQLGLVQKKRQIASSVYAYLNEDYNLDHGIDAYAAFPDAKIDQLKIVLQTVFADGQKKVIVFALFRKTIKYLDIRLKKLGYNCVQLHGGVKDRADVLMKFEQDDSIQVLLSTEVGSEGLDLQFCNSLINYDLPWNPMVVEQRIGRIDRFGQQSPKVHIYNFIVQNSIQEDIYTRLLDRIGIFRGTVGDMEAILDAKVEIEGRGERTIQQLYEDLEKELYFNKLTRAEKQQKIREVEQAIKNEQEDLKVLEEGLTNALTNDAYFKDEIQRLLRQNAYVTEKELFNYIYMTIVECLTTCSIKEVRSHIYEFNVAPSTPGALRNFITQYQPANDDLKFAFQSFKCSITDKTSFLLTFDQEEAFKDKTLIYINLYHPLIQSCLSFFKEKYTQVNKTFSYVLNADNILISQKTYFLAVYQIRTSRLVQGVRVNSDSLFPIAFDIDNQKAVEDEEITNRIFSVSQTEGLQKNMHYDDVNHEVIQSLRYDLLFAIRQQKDTRLQEMQVQLENDKMRELAQLQEWYSSRKKSIERKISDYQNQLMFYGEGIFGENDYYKDEKRRLNQSIAQQKVQLRRLEDEREEHYQIITADPSLLIEETLVALNYIRID